MPKSSRVLNCIAGPDVYIATQWEQWKPKITCTCSTDKKLKPPSNIPLLPAILPYWHFVDLAVFSPLSFPGIFRLTAADNRLFLVIRINSTCEILSVNISLTLVLASGVSYLLVNGLLRWLPRVLLRLNSARYYCLPNVSINRMFKNDTSNPKQKQNHFST